MIFVENVYNCIYDEYDEFFGMKKMIRYCN